MRMRRPQAAVLVVFATVLLGVHPSGAPASPGSGPTAAVSLGDSYISGEAGRWAGNSNTQSGSRDGTDRAWIGGSSYDLNRVYLEGTAANGCHRSDVAEIRSAGLGVAEAINLSCSGAVAANVWRASSGGQARNGEAPQADRLAGVAAAKDVRLVVVSVGGNDLGFADIIAACAEAWTTSPSWWRKYCAAEQQQVVNGRMPTAMANVGKALDEVRAVMAGAGYATSQYRLVLQSYPSPVPRGSEVRYSETGWTRLSTGGCPFWNRDLDWARDSLVNQIADNLRSVASSRGAQFLDLRNLLQGREVCATASSLVTSSNPPSATRSEWTRLLVSGYGQGDLQESFHPNYYGQLALGRCLALIAGQTGSAYACRNTPGAGPGSVTLGAAAVARTARTARKGSPRVIHRRWPARFPDRKAPARRRPR